MKQLKKLMDTETTGRLYSIKIIKTKIPDFEKIPEIC